MKHLTVVAAILTNKNQILSLQRDKHKYDYMSYKYEFPGGKVEEGESNVVALMRELEEEMDLKIDITEDQYYMTVEYEYPDFSITMHTYICPLDSREFLMKAHIDEKWLSREELDSLDWAKADMPIVEKLMG